MLLELDSCPGARAVRCATMTADHARSRKDRYLRALARAIADYEAEFGTISEAEMIAQQRQDRRAAIAVRTPGTRRSGRRIARSADLARKDETIGTERSYLRMTYTPASLGPATMTLTVRSNDPDFPPRQYTGTGTGS